MHHLVFTLYAPYGAWGAASASSATTAYKATELEPSRSALIGLLGAALGWERARLPTLDRAVVVAVREVLAPRRDPKPDYHTITPVRRPEGHVRWTRFDELRPQLMGGGQTGSILSRREHWGNGLWTVTLGRTDAEGPTLEDLAHALRRPVWPLYAGRKACGLGLPPDPEIVLADGPLAALAGYGLPWTRRPALVGILTPLAEAMARQPAPGRLLYDPDYPGAPAPMRTVARRDRADHLRHSSGRLFRRYRERTQAELPWPAEAPG